tara:strand:+ start:255 stop:947 length:693 start_codon:yes stop_codon:yes gene_type:complete
MLNKGTTLVIVAHADDEVLGCGGLVARLTKEGNSVHLLVIADGESSRLNNKDIESKKFLISKRNQALENSSKILGFKTIESLNYPDNRLDSIDLLDLIKEIEKRLIRYKPELILTHYHSDLNLDHRRINEATSVACRPLAGQSVKEILFFEIPSSTEWTINSGNLFSPNYFIDISKTIEKKLNALKCYEKELRVFPHPRSLKAVENLALWRGSISGLNYAEAFIIARKIT